MKEIKLTQGKVALVDDEDFESLSKHRWYAQKCKKTYYACRRKRIGKRSDNKSLTISMHREIMQTPNGLQTDHEDHNGLNNQRYNLRVSTVIQNQYNANPRGKSKYLGVSFNTKKYGTYIRAEISVNKKRIRLGNFKTEEDAAIARDAAAKKYHGEFANLNFK